MTLPKRIYAKTYKNTNKNDVNRHVKTLHRQDNAYLEAERSLEKHLTRIYMAKFK